MSDAIVLADHWDGPGPWWPIIPLLWFAFVVTGFVLVARFGWGRRRWYGGAHSGESRLAQRYAAGEIDEQEYRDRLDVLRETRR